ncbi:MAG: nucleoside triphosphate pyrophosphohydrolase family protein [Patescibacteria group bacterium]|nr:nucleoside triphosphate pyrophosphohydrolase family protein [Patescibacteria group bacterium]
MNFNEYQEKSRKTAVYPDLDNNVVYPTLGLNDEAGEVAGKVKKMFRDDGGVLTDERREAIIQEVGDVLWYVAQLATELKISLDEVAEKNLAKLYSRLDRDQLHGDGDNR